MGGLVTNNVGCLARLKTSFEQNPVTRINKGPFSLVLSSGLLQHFQIAIVDRIIETNVIVFSPTFFLQVVLCNRLSSSVPENRQISFLTIPEYLDACYIDNDAFPTSTNTNRAGCYYVIQEPLIMIKLWLFDCLLQSTLLQCFTWSCTRPHLIP